MKEPTRILVVDDAAVVRGLVSRYLNAEPDLEVIGSASNGKIGVEKARTLQPDAIVLDIEMPEMNGLDALTEIRRFDPKVPIIMFSTLTAAGASSTLKALARGASDYATKPEYAVNASSALEHVRNELISKIRGLTQRPTPVAKRPMPARRRPAAVKGLPPRAIVIGSSTGGPNALERVLSDIPVALPIPIVVVQHMPPTFTKALAERLDKKVASRVVEAGRPMPAEAGTVYIAPGGHHLRMRAEGKDLGVEPFDGPPIHSCRPSVEPLFASAAEVCGPRLLAAMLTGMGQDGVDGARTIADLGCVVVAQDEETSVVWGMPGAVVNAGAATDVLPLNQIGGFLAQHVNTSAAAAPGRSFQEVQT